MLTYLPRVTGTLEHTPDLTADEATVLRVIARSGFADMNDAVDFLRVAFKGWFIYEGGSHVALHKTALSPRVLLLRAA